MGIQAQLPVRSDRREFDVRSIGIAAREGDEVILGAYGVCIESVWDGRIEAVCFVPIGGMRVDS